MKKLRLLFLLLLLLVFASQFIEVDRTNPAVEADVPAPPEVKVVLRRACYDCHSNESVWPWYTGIAPASWFAVHHVSRGRSAINFSTWNRYGFQMRDKIKKEIITDVEQKRMPPKFYMFLHFDSILSPEERVLVKSWAENSSYMEDEF
jgi:hypothetical protein